MTEQIQPSPQPSQENDAGKGELPSGRSWYKATVFLAHEGTGSDVEGTVYVFAKNAGDAYK